jgi:hypothetical protein
VLISGTFLDTFFVDALLVLTDERSGRRPSLPTGFHACTLMAVCSIANDPSSNSHPIVPILTCPRATFHFHKIVISPARISDILEIN